MKEKRVNEAVKETDAFQIYKPGNVTRIQPTGNQTSNRTQLRGLLFQHFSVFRCAIVPLIGKG
jgi:hypothetical protein